MEQNHFKLCKIPFLVFSLDQHGIVSGGGSGGGSGLGLGGTMGAAGIARAAMSGAAGSVLTQSGGRLSALNAAFKAASQSSNSGDTSALSGMDKGSKTGGLAEAMGTAAKFAGSFGSHLASGTMDVAREKANSIKENFAEKIADTTGGKIADAIQSKANISSSESQESNAQNISSIGTPGGTLSSGSDEVSQFVNHKASGIHS